MPSQVESVTAERRSTRITALVTGATGGIGFHTAAALARAGMHVIVTIYTALARRLAGAQATAVAVNPGMAWTPGIAALTP